VNEYQYTFLCILIRVNATGASLLTPASE